MSLVSWIVMISACVLWISSLNSSSLFLIPFMLTWSIKRLLSLLLLGVCDCVVCVVIWSSFVWMWGCLWTLCSWCSCCGDCDACVGICVGCEYADRVRGCEGDGYAGVGGGEGVIAVIAGHEYGGCTRVSGIVCSAADVLGMSVVRQLRGVGGVCEMCMRLARGGVGGEWIRGLGMSFFNPVETGGVLDVCQCFGFGGVGDVGGEWVGWLGQGLEGWVLLCLCELWVYIVCVDGKPRYLYIGIGGYLRILGAPSVQSYCTLSMSASYRVFACGRYRKYRLHVVVELGFITTSLAFMRSTFICTEACQNLCDSSTACRLCCLEPSCGSHQF